MSGFKSEREEMSAAEVDAYKLQYALALLRYPDNVYEAALEVFEGDTALAMRAVNMWTFDLKVLQYKREIKEREGEEAFWPSKGQFLQVLWNRMKQAPSADLAKIADVYAKTRGFYPEPGGNKFEQNNVVNKVMVVRDHGTDESWRQNLLVQQQRLIANGE